MPTIYDKFSAKNEKNPLFEVQEEYRKTLLDGSFQRYGGYDTGTGWKLKEGIAYLENLLVGATFNAIINIDVKAALRYAIEQNCHDSIEYYQDVLKRCYEYTDEEGKVHKQYYEYISVDGNNSASFIDAFLNSEEGVKIRHNGAKDPVYLKDMDEKQQREIVHRQMIPRVILTDILIDDACELFRNINTSTKLNNQEHRQARRTDLSQFIRDVSNGANRDIFVNLVYTNKSSLDTRSHEEMVAQFVLKANSNFTKMLSRQELDNLYEQTNMLDKETKDVIVNVLGNVYEIAKKINGGEPLQRKLKKGQLQNLFDFVHTVIEKHEFRIEDHVRFFNWFLETDTKFLTESKTITEEELEDKSYTYWTKYYYNKASNYNNSRTLFEATFLKDVESLVADDVLAKPTKPRGNNNNFSWEDKLKLYSLQEKTLRNGKKMTILDLYLGKYEADHVTSVKDGGETTIPNGELMTMHENRSKGASSNEPHFPHQQQ
jgi:hypothetical protein